MTCHVQQGRRNCGFVGIASRANPNTHANPAVNIAFESWIVARSVVVVVVNNNRFVLHICLFSLWLDFRVCLGIVSSELGQRKAWTWLWFLCFHTSTSALLPVVLVCGVWSRRCSGDDQNRRLVGVVFFVGCSSHLTPSGVCPPYQCAPRKTACQSNHSLPCKLFGVWFMCN